MTNEYTSLCKSLTLYFQKGDVCCVLEMSGDKDGLLYWPKFFLDHSSTSFASWLGLLNRGSLRSQSPISAAGSHFGILSPTDSNRPGTWLYYFLISTCFRCSSVYLLRYISWLTVRSRVNTKQMNLAWELRKLRNMRVEVRPTVISAFKRRLLKDAGRVGNWRTRCGHPNYSLIEIG